MTQTLEAQLHASKGKGKRKNKGKPPKSWWDMSRAEQWWLDELWSGRLHTQLGEAKKNQGGRVQADRIFMRPFQREGASEHMVK